MHTVPRDSHHPETVRKEWEQPDLVHVNFQEGNRRVFYHVTIEGTAPIIQHSAASMDPLLPINVEKSAITGKVGSNRTGVDDERLRQLETIGSFWLDGDDKPTIPPAAIRAMLETSARKVRQGPQVREGLIVAATAFRLRCRQVRNDARGTRQDHSVHRARGRKAHPPHADQGEVQPSLVM